VGTELEIPPAPGFEIRCFVHGERRREARKEVSVVLAIAHALRAHEALGRSDALSSFLEVVHRLFEDGVFVGHERSIRAGNIRSPDAFVFSRENPYMFRDAMLKLLLAESLPYKKLIAD
jgi:hypothetical protein